MYIGLTIRSVEQRWKQHLIEGHNEKNTKPLYKAMRKYGEQNFTVETIATANSLEELSKLEQYYIALYESNDLSRGYNLTSGGEIRGIGYSYYHTLSPDEVADIRRMYFYGDLSVKQSWEMYYKDRMSYSGFQKVWDGFSWPDILPEVYTPERIKSQNRFKRHVGSQNGNAAMTDEQVLEARKYYVDHTLQQTYEKFGNKYTKDGFREMLTRTYSYLPMYHKCKDPKQQWTLNGQIIDIDTYKPVSAILESEE